ncbi:hypothetical protein BDW66DRAFT_128340 [Aspergillus desertorum]
MVLLQYQPSFRSNSYNRLRSTAQLFPFLDAPSAIDANDIPPFDLYLLARPLQSHLQECHQRPSFLRKKATQECVRTSKYLHLTVPTLNLNEGSFPRLAKLRLESKRAKQLLHLRLLRGRNLQQPLSQNISISSPYVGLCRGMTYVEQLTTGSWGTKWLPIMAPPGGSDASM